jgi:hypothetical protein
VGSQTAGDGEVGVWGCARLAFAAVQAATATPATTTATATESQAVLAPLAGPGPHPSAPSPRQLPQERNELIGLK